MVCREVRGAFRGPLQCCTRESEVHGTFNVSKWGQDSGGFASEANRQQTLNLPNPGGGSHPPGEGTGAIGGSRGYHFP